MYIAIPLNVHALLSLWGKWSDAWFEHALSIAVSEGCIEKKVSATRKYLNYTLQTNGIVRKRHRTLIITATRQQGDK